MFILPIKRNKSANTNKENIFLFLGLDKDLTLLVRISIRDGKSGLRSSF